MAEQQPQRLGEGIKGMFPEKGPSTSQILAVVILLPLGGTLLLISGLTLAGTLIGLAVTTPLFVIFSPVWVPAAFVIGLALVGFLASGAFGITALSSFSWMANNVRQMMKGESLQQQQQKERAKRRAQDAPGQLGQRARDMGQSALSKAQEMMRGPEGGKS